MSVQNKARSTNVSPKWIDTCKSRVSEFDKYKPTMSPRARGAAPTGKFGGSGGRRLLGSFTKGPYRNSLNTFQLLFSAFKSFSYLSVLCLCFNIWTLELLKSWNSRLNSNLEFQAWILKFQGWISTLHFNLDLQDSTLTRPNLHSCLLYGPSIGRHARRAPR